MLSDILWRNRSALSLGFCLGFSLLCVLWQRNPFSQKMGYIGRFADQVSSLINSSLNYTGTLWVELDKYRTLEQRYKKAQETIESYRLEKDKFAFLERQNQYLRDALAFRVNSSYPEVQAEVLGVRLNSISPRIIIGKGQKDGIKSFMPVLARAHDHKDNLLQSVVGITVVAKEDTALIQPLTHPSFELGVRIEHSQEWAILSGNSGRTNETLLTYITSDFSPKQDILSQSPVSLVKNALVYTSGAGGIFPPGISIGVVSGTGRRKYDFKTAYVQPFVKISQLNYVSVLIKKVEKWTQVWKKEPHWKDYLKTEFGEPVYPKLPEEDDTRSKKAAQRKKKQLAKTREKREEKRKAERTKEDRSLQRRLQNVSPLLPGGRAP